MNIFHEAYSFSGTFWVGCKLFFFTILPFYLSCEFERGAYEVSRSSC